MWGGVYTSMDCLLIYYRQKDDPYNAIMAGFVTGGVLAIRGKQTHQSTEFQRTIEFRRPQFSVQTSSHGRSHSGTYWRSFNCLHNNDDEAAIRNDGI